MLSVPNRLGLDVEKKVLADGTFQFDQYIHWLEKRFNHMTAEHQCRYLYTDDEVITDILSKHDSDETMTAEDVASRYTYPLKYVEEVLLGKINAARDQSLPLVPG